MHSAEIETTISAAETYAFDRTATKIRRTIKIGSLCFNRFRKSKKFIEYFL
jgi:hypothetical protein